MSLNDPIADLLTRIRNASSAQHRFVDVPLSKSSLAILKVLEGKGFIGKVLRNDEQRIARVFLKYEQGRKGIIHALRRISKPGLRRYSKSVDLPYVLGGLGMAIVSTSRGVMDGETARKEKIGGEVLCLVW